MDFSLGKIWHDMGLFATLVVIVTLVMSLASIFVMVERFIALYRSQRDSRSFARRMGGMLGGGDLAVAAQQDLGRSIGHLGRVIRAGLKAYGDGDRSDPDLTFESVARALERQAQRELLTLRRGQGVLATVGSTAPFVGLLGTVVGIVNAFTSMAKEGAGGLGTVSAGIAEALITTAFGLLVAIPAVMAFNYLSNWTDARSVDISESSNELLDLVARDLRRVKQRAAG